MQVYKFLDKNYDQVRQDVLDLFIQSRNKVRGELELICVVAEMCVYRVCENVCASVPRWCQTCSWPTQRPWVNRGGAT